jgi:hypothetical protein
MTVLVDQTVLYVWSNYEVGNSHVWLQAVGAWRKIRNDNVDACTNMTTLAALARATNRPVDVEINDATNRIQYITIK